jgi:hypothetical protein
MTQADLIWKLYDAIAFLAKPMAIPKRIIIEAAEAALKVITDYMKQDAKN